MQESEFRERVLKAVEKPKEGQFWAILNKPFTLWLMSLVLISFFGSYLSAYQQCRKDADEEIDRATKISRELFQRELNIQKIILSKQTIKEMRDELSKPNSYYPEFAGFQIQMLRDASASFWNRVIQPKISPPTPEQLALSRLSFISEGIIPGNLGDADVGAVREYAIKMLAQARPVPIPGYGSYNYEAVCSPMTLWSRFWQGSSARIVRQATPATTPRPQILPLPHSDTIPWPRS